MFAKYQAPKSSPSFRVPCQSLLASGSNAAEDVDNSNHSRQAWGCIEIEAISQKAVDNNLINRLRANIPAAFIAEAWHMTL